MSTASHSLWHLQNVNRSRGIVFSLIFIESTLLSAESRLTEAASQARLMLCCSHTKHFPYKEYNTLDPEGLTRYWAIPAEMCGAKLARGSEKCDAAFRLKFSGCNVFYIPV